MEYSISCISRCYECMFALLYATSYSFIQAYMHHGSRFKIEYSPVQTDLSVLASTSADKMAKTSVPLSDIEKMIEKMVASSLKKLLQTDNGKEQVVIEDEEPGVEFERKEHIDDTWQNEVFFLKEPTDKVSRARASDVINILAVKPKAWELKSKKEKEDGEKEPKKGVEGPQAA
ncbi:hypothetical protein JCGZ_20212 [Jatropha curcas]|uniref:Uncharacterized protein n=1 Tax=Jatropha curcas TaxID=180498 RepID=A0A067JX64_JATCU|nr:hypothetical protein JCGZ_20212 [Jatropha curcas]